jgi:hypothetical protein
LIFEQLSSAISYQLSAISYQLFSFQLSAVDSQPVSFRVALRSDSFGTGGAMQDFRNLKVWERSHALTLGLYKLTRGFPKEEPYGLTTQIRRCAASIPANIAEGCGVVPTPILGGSSR